MRALLVAGVAVVAVTASAFAAALAPNEIQTTFFTGQPFTASATNIKYKMIFSTLVVAGGKDLKAVGLGALPGGAEAVLGELPGAFALGAALVGDEGNHVGRDLDEMTW